MKNWWEEYKELATDGLLGFFALFMLAHFIYFMVTGQPVVVFESVTTTCIIESVFCIGCGALAIERFIKDCKGRK